MFIDVFFFCEVLVVLDWVKGDGLLLVVVQDVDMLVVLMFGYVNVELLEFILVIGYMIFYSCSWQWLWIKGELFGNVLVVMVVWVDCDSDSLLVSVCLVGLICYIGVESCFVQVFGSFFGWLDVLVWQCVQDCLVGSYIILLFEVGICCIVQKVGEEGVEIVLVGVVQDDVVLFGELVDLLFYFIVLLCVWGFGLEDVVVVLVVWYVV